MLPTSCYRSPKPRATLPGHSHAWYRSSSVEKRKALERMPTLSVAFCGSLALPALGRKSVEFTEPDKGNKQQTLLTTTHRTKTRRGPMGSSCVGQRANSSMAQLPGTPWAMNLSRSRLVSWEWTWEDVGQTTRSLRSADPLLCKVPGSSSPNNHCPL